MQIDPKNQTNLSKNLDSANRKSKSNKKQRIAPALTRENSSPILQFKESLDLSPSNYKTTFRLDTEEKEETLPAKVTRGSSKIAPISSQKSKMKSNNTINSSPRMSDQTSSHLQSEQAQSPGPLLAKHTVVDLEDFTDGEILLTRMSSVSSPVKKKEIKFLKFTPETGNMIEGIPPNFPTPSSLIQTPDFQDIVDHDQKKLECPRFSLTPEQVINRETEPSNPTQIEPKISLPNLENIKEGPRTQNNFDLLGQEFEEQNQSDYLSVYNQTLNTLKERKKAGNLNMNEKFIKKIKIPTITTNIGENDVFNNSRPRENNANNLSLRGLPPQIPSPTNALLLQNHTDGDIEDSSAVNDNLQEEDQQSPTPQQNPQQSANQVSEIQAKLHIKRNINFYIASACISTLLWAMVNAHISFQFVFLGIFCYLIFLILERCYSLKHIQLPPYDSWLQTEDVLTAFETGAILLTVSLIDLNILNVFSGCSFGGLAYLFVISVHIFKSTAPVNFKKQQHAKKLICLIQLAWITLKIDKIIPLDWVIIFVPSWIYGSVICLYFLAYFGLFLFFILAALVRRYRLIVIKEELLGMLWNSIYYSQRLSIVVITVGLSQLFGSNRNLAILLWSIKINIGISMFGVVYSLLTFPSLIKAVRDHLTRVYFDEDELSQSIDTESVITFEVEKKNTYFLKVSSTYFLPLNMSFSLKNTENIKRIKNLFNSFKSRKQKDPQKKENSIEINKDPEVVAAQIIQQSRKTFNERKQKNPVPGGSCYIKAKLPFMTDRFWSRSQGVDLESPKLNLSADNIDVIKDKDKSASKDKVNEEEEDLCYLCYDNERNAVMMNCGHGGVCYDCAISVVKNKSECMECRGTVKAVHKIEPTPKIMDIIKSSEVSKLVIITRQLQTP